MKLVRQGEDFIILSDADVAIQVIKQSEVIDGNKIIEAENVRKRYAARVAKMPNEKLIEMLISFFCIDLCGGLKHKDHDVMGEAVYTEVLNRMSR